MKSLPALPAEEIWRFDEYEVDCLLWQLRWRQEVIPLPRKAFDLLVYLIRMRPRVVTKDELLSALWPDQFVEENNLPQQIFVLRKAFARQGPRTGLIETVSGRGYRFAASVEVVRRAATAEAAASGGEAPGPETQGAVSAPEAVLQAEGRGDVAGGGPPAGEVARRWGRTGASLISILAGVACLVGLLAWWWLPEPAYLTVVTTRRLSNDGVAKHLGTTSTPLVTDGLRLFFTEARDNQTRLATMPVGGGEIFSSAAPGAEAVVTDYSRRQDALLFGSAWRSEDTNPILAKSLKATGASPVGELNGHDATWSPQGDRVAYANERFLYIARADGSNGRRVANAAGIVYWPRWSPDGQHLRYSVNLGSNEEQIWEVSAAGGEPRQMHADLPDHNQICCGSWTADGRNYFFVKTGPAEDSLWVAPKEHWWQHRTPSAMQLATGAADFWRSPLPSADGRRLWAIGSHLRGELNRIDPATHRPQPYLEGMSAEGLTFAPGHDWIAYTAYPEGTLWISRPDGTQKRQLSRPPETARFPRWSPDGRTLLYLAGQAGSRWSLYLVRPDTGATRQLLEDGMGQGVGSWSPDGRHISFGRLLDFGTEHNPDLNVEMYDLDRGTCAKLAGSDGLWTARWSPDGRYMAAATQNNRTLRLFDMRQQEWTDLASLGVNDITWSPDSRFLFFDTNFGNSPTLYRVRLADRKVEPWADLHGFARGGFFSPWLGMSPEGDPLFLRETAIEEIYELTLDLPR